MFLSQSEQSCRLGSEFFGILALMGSTFPGWALCLTLLASFSTILDLPFVAKFAWEGILV